MAKRRASVCAALSGLASDTDTCRRDCRLERAIELNVDTFVSARRSRSELHVCRWLDANGNPASPALVRELATRFWVGVRQDRLELEARQAAGDLDSEREG